MISRARLIALPVAAAMTLAGCSTGGKADTSTIAGKDRVPDVVCSAGSAPTFKGHASAFDSAVPVDGSGALTTQVSEPVLSPGTTPADGFKIAEVKVNAQVLTNGVFALHPEAFVLADNTGTRCPQPATNPLKGGLKVSQVDESHAAAGTLAFVVPAEANLSDYTVYYLERPGAAKAVAAWSGHGAAPTSQTVTTCSGNRSGISLTGAKDQPFATAFTTGDNTISLSVTPSKPWIRTLRPGQNQPNDVDGVSIALYVAAKGSVGFIERNQFQLLDDRGNLCRYNELGSDGETLTSALVEAGKAQRFDLVFWTPKGSEVAGWKLLYLPEPSDKRVAASWTLQPRPAAEPSAPAGAPTKSAPTS